MKKTSRPWFLEKRIGKGFVNSSRSTRKGILLEKNLSLRLHEEETEYVEAIQEDVAWVCQALARRPNRFFAKEDPAWRPKNDGNLVASQDLCEWFVYFVYQLVQCCVSSWNGISSQALEMEKVKKGGKPWKGETLYASDLVRPVVFLFCVLTCFNTAGLAMIREF